MDIIGPNDAVGQVNVEGQPNKTKRLVIIPLPGGTQSNGLNHHRQPGIYGIRFKLAATEVSAVGAPPTHLHSSPFHSERRSQKFRNRLPGMSEPLPQLFLTTAPPVNVNRGGKL